MSLTAAAFFLRFWQKTRDPLFIYFAVAFLQHLLGATDIVAKR